MVLLSFALSACGVLPGGGRFYSDYRNADTYAAIGANRTKVRYDFGKPDKIITRGPAEEWIYYNRQGGATFTFSFNPQGMLVATDIAKLE